MLNKPSGRPNKRFKNSGNSRGFKPPTMIGINDQNTNNSSSYKNIKQNCSQGSGTSSSSQNFNISNYKPVSKYTNRGAPAFQSALAMMHSQYTKNPGNKRSMPKSNEPRNSRFPSYKDRKPVRNIDQYTMFKAIYKWNLYTKCIKLMTYL